MRDELLDQLPDYLVSPDAHVRELTVGQVRPHVAPGQGIRVGVGDAIIQRATDPLEEVTEPGSLGTG